MSALTSVPTFRPFRHRDFTLIWVAAFVSNAGAWMQTIAVGTLVTERTGEAGAAGLVAAAAFVPIGVLSPVGGALADRVDRRRFLFWTTVGETAFAAVLVVLHVADATSPVAVSLVVFAGGAMAALGFPCYQAMLPDLVDHDELLAAVSLSTTQFNLGRVLGPALAGVVIHLGGYAWAFGVNAASFGAVLLALVVVRVPRPIASDDLGMWRRIVDGARTARREPGSWSALSFAAVMALALSPFIALVPAIAVVVFDGGAATTSIFVTAQGLGAVAGAMAVPVLAARVGRRTVLLASFGLAPLALALYSAAGSVALAALALTAVGASYIGLFSGLNVVLQLRAPEGYRARLLSLYFVVVGVLYPLGAAVQGRVADEIGLREVTAAGAALWSLVVVTVALVRPRRLADLGDPVTSGGNPGRNRSWWKR